MTEQQHVTREEYERVVRAIHQPEDADEIMACYDSGWYGFSLFSPMSLGLAAVSPAHAAELLKFNPDFAERIAQLQRDPEATLAEMKTLMDSL